MKTTIHAIAGITAFLLILTFFTSTVAVEMSGSAAAISYVKQWIVYGLFVLIPAIAITGVFGALLDKKATNKLIGIKKRRMPIITANGLLVLLPAALYLNHLAQTGDFGTGFYLAQTAEFIAGSVNLLLMGMNIRDGLLISGRIRKPRPIVDN